jgi:all-trans-retinol 13,14-reductase
MKNYDVLILGSGISGLSSALLLAQKGYRVAIIEKHFKAGGYLHSFKRHGITFDTGAHYVGAMGEGQPFRVFLEHLEVFDKNLFVPLEPDGFDQMTFLDNEYLFKNGLENTIKSLSEKFPDEQLAIQKYFDLVQETAKEFPTYYFSGNFDQTKVLDSFEMSVAEVVNSLTQNQRLKSLFYAYCTLHGVNPKDAPWGPHAVITDTLIQGAYAFRGHGDDLVNNYIREIKKYGGEIILSSEVKKIEILDNVVQSVEVKTGELYKADWVISSMHPKITYELTHTQLPARLNNMQESVGVFALYLKLKNGLNLVPLRNYYFFTSDLGETFLDENNPLDPKFFYLCRPARHLEAESNEAPHVTIHIPCHIKYLKAWSDSKFGQREDSYKEFKLAVTKKIISELKKFHLEIELDESMLTTSSPLTNLHYNGSLEGSAYGIYHSKDNTGIRGIQPRTKIKNLILTGQNISFPGIQSSATSAIRSCASIIGAKNTLNELKEKVAL